MRTRLGGPLRVAAAGCLVATLATRLAAAAQAYPSKPGRIITQKPDGQGLDIVGNTPEEFVCLIRRQSALVGRIGQGRGHRTDGVSSPAGDNG
jgi:tripartite-type tricarboxylate transporter receptor subunit TctC